MKRLIVVILLMVLCFSILIPVDANVTGKRDTRVYKEHVQGLPKDITFNDNHDMVMGFARKELTPNFLSNDWEDSGFINHWGLDDYGFVGIDVFNTLLSPTEMNYLQSITGLQASVPYFIDLTGHTIQTAPFTILTTHINVTIPITTAPAGTTTHNSYTQTTVASENLDPYTILETTTTALVNETHNINYQVVAKIYDASPLVLDLNLDKKIDTAKNQYLPHAPKFYREFAKFFDITGDGSEEFTEWIAVNAKDGLLVMPENGKVENALQLFGTAGGYANGFEKLSLLCDKNGDGWVDGKELEGLAIWIDDNDNAICDNGELKALADFGITRLATAQNKYVGKYMTADNHEHVMWDWWPACYEVRKARR